MDFHLPEFEPACYANSAGVKQPKQIFLATLYYDSPDHIMQVAFSGLPTPGRVIEALRYCAVYYTWYDSVLQSRAKFDAFCDAFMARYSDREPLGNAGWSLPVPGVGNIHVSGIDFFHS